MLSNETNKQTRCRHTLCVQIPVQAEVFGQLPRDLQQGHLVRVCPAFFNIGINEDATYAETRYDLAVFSV